MTGWNCYLISFMLKWKRQPAAVKQEWAFPFIKNLHGDKESAYSKYMGDAIFKIPTPLMLDKIVTAMDGIYEQMAKLSDTDARGDVYEYLLSKLSTAGVNGEFRTPRHIIHRSGQHRGYFQRFIPLDRHPKGD